MVNMKNKEKTKEQLLSELTELRNRIIEFESSEVEQRQGENLDSESEWKFRNLAENLNELVYRADLSTNAATYVNSSVEKIYGYTVKEWLNDPDLWGKTILPEDKENLFAKISEAHKKLAATSLEYRIIRKDGEVRWVQDNISWEKDHMGNVISLLGVMYDITERKQAEEKLSKSENELSSIYDAITDFMTVISTDYRIARVNRIVEKQYGKDLVGKVCYEVYQGRKEICPECPTREAIETKKPAFSFQPATEVSPPVDIYAFPILNKEGDVIAVVEHGKDITERKRAEEELMESEERYRNIAENSSIGISTYNDSGQCVVANQALADMIGTTVEQVLSQNINALQSWQKSGLLDAAKEVFESGEKMVKTVHLVSTFGNEVWLDCKLVPYCERGEKFLMLLVEEVTHRKTMEEELLKAQKLESIGVLAGGIAHDFNNLLTAIMNNLFLMKNHINPEEQVYDWIKATEKAAVRAQGLTQQLLTFSKGGAPVKGLIDIRELVSDSISIALRGSNVGCEYVIPDDIWHIEADAGQMNQAINNILINAGQSMPEGGTITINCENVIVGTENNLTLKEGNYIKISIEDQGTGISGEHLPRIFDPYFTTKQKGSGLGLSTTYSIIKKHHGHINAESELGAGTVFNIYLPASTETLKIKKPAEDVPETGTGKVLVMDDNELVRDSLGQMLFSIGYVVEFASDGKEAVDIYKNAMASGHLFNAVIMDLTIPGGMGGKEAVRELLKIDPHVKAIVSSGYSYDPIMSKYRDYGFRAVLKKPYKDMRELNRILNDEIEGK